MRVDLFDFELPADRIATHPVEPRDASRLLHVQDGGMSDKKFNELSELLHAEDVLVLNNSKVIPARLFGKRGEAKVELLLHQACERLAGGQSEPHISWTAFAKPAKRLKAGDNIHMAEGFSARIVDKLESGEVKISFGLSQNELFAQLEKHGHMPLPPYIKRADNESDKTRYQTVYAAQEGSVAAPTAGLHFTPALLQQLRDKGVKVAYVTLHVGAGTFQPVKVDDTRDHAMHSEWIEVSPETAQLVNEAKSNGGNVVAVGTTSLRTLESAADADGTLQPCTKETDIFITPGYRFRVVDRLITNFHLPRSTLFMLVCAFAGTEHMKTAYTHAIETGYRFYSYGDACLLDRCQNSEYSIQEN